MWLDMGRKAYWQQYLLKIVEQLQRVKNRYLLNVRMNQLPHILDYTSISFNCSGIWEPCGCFTRSAAFRDWSSTRAGVEHKWWCFRSWECVKVLAAVPTAVLMPQLPLLSCQGREQVLLVWRPELAWGEQLGVGCSPWKQGILLGGTCIGWPGTVGQGLWCECLKGSGSPCASHLLDIKHGLASYSYCPSQRNI